MNKSPPYLEGLEIDGNLNRHILEGLEVDGVLSGDGPVANVNALLLLHQLDKLVAVLADDCHPVLFSYQIQIQIQIQLGLPPVIAGNIMPFNPILILVVENRKASLVVVFLVIVMTMMEVMLLLTLKAER